MDEFLTIMFVVICVYICVNECYLKPKKSKESRFKEGSNKELWLKNNNVKADIYYHYSDSMNTINTEYIIDEFQKKVFVSNTSGSN